MSDYRVRPARKIPWVYIVTAILGVVLLAWLGGAEFMKRRAAALVTAKEWAIDGDPCPTITAAEFAAKNYRLRMSFDYGGAQFARAAGHVSCAAVAYKGGKGLGEFPVCQFTSPAVVRVVTKQGEFYFVPGVGKPATVSVPHGVGACVLNSTFTLN
ncbi:MAG: hypothetical protein ABW360_09975 [Phenylobacterium sp.]